MYTHVFCNLLLRLGPGFCCRKGLLGLLGLISQRACLSGRLGRLLTHTVCLGLEAARIQGMGNGM